MKKTLLSTAVALGVASTASAEFMHINPEGLGEALIYPYYSTVNGSSTNIHIVNTTGAPKAVKVRILEGENSIEVLDFNLYLSAEDHFAFAIADNPDGGNAMLVTADNSCTVPELGTANAGGATDGSQETTADGRTLRYQPFVNFAYLGDTEDDDPTTTTVNEAYDNTSLDRTRAGYIEVIEMGQLDTEDTDSSTATAAAANAAFSAAITHGANGVPANCALVRAAWATGGIWNTDPTADFVSLWAGGGLYGFGNVVNVAEGTSFGYDAIAIDDFVDEDGVQAPIGAELHEVPGTELPSLQQGSDLAAVFNDGNVVFAGFTDSRDAVSALFMSSQIMNDYVVDSAIGAKTDWVVTMPTKRFYVNGNGTPEALGPFSENWDGLRSCEPVSVDHWDREEAFTAPAVAGAQFSPRPPAAAAGPDPVLCTEVSVIEMGENGALETSADITYGFADSIGYDEGWARISFLRADIPNSIASTTTDVGTRAIVGDVLDSTGAAITGDPTVTFNGLPVAGFAVVEYVFDGVSDGVIANYSFSTEHKTSVLLGAQD
jgi:hypothetical protein